MTQRVCSYERVLIDNKNILFFVGTWSDFTEVNTAIQRQFHDHLTRFGDLLEDKGTVIHSVPHYQHGNLNQIMNKNWPSVLKYLFEPSHISLYKSNLAARLGNVNQNLKFMLIIDRTLAQFDPRSHSSAIIWLGGYEHHPLTLSNVFNTLARFTLFSSDIFVRLSEVFDALPTQSRSIIASDDTDRRSGRGPLNFRVTGYPKFVSLDASAFLDGAVRQQGGSLRVNNIDFINIKELKGKIDFGIITIREDEFLAACRHFAPTRWTIGRSRYEVAEVDTVNGDCHTVGIVRLHGQGRVIAQKIASNMIEDLDPKWLLLVGIGGAVPSDDFTLGDVVCGSHLYDFSVRAALEGRRDSLNITGGNMHPLVDLLLSNLLAIRGLRVWNSKKAIKAQKPRLIVPKPGSDLYYGEPSWRKNVRDFLLHHFSYREEMTPEEVIKVRRPLVTSRPVASSDVLMKSATDLQQWQESARSVAAVEMELGGVYEAARQAHKQYPVLAVRGISDIVGYKRDDEWIKYACNTAAAFAVALLRSEASFEIGQN